MLRKFAERLAERSLSRRDRTALKRQVGVAYTLCSQKKSFLLRAAYPPRSQPISSTPPGDVLARMAHWPLLLLAVAGAAAVTTTGEQPRSRKKPAWSGRLATYSIASVARREQRSDWNEVTQGNKIVLPRSVYDTLVSRGLSYKQFQIINPENREKKLFTGPLDFCAADGACHLPTAAQATTTALSAALSTAPTLSRRVLPPQLGDEAAQAQGGRSLRGGDVPLPEGDFRALPAALLLLPRHHRPRHDAAQHPRELRRAHRGQHRARH